MSKIPNYLKTGDTIGITAPAGYMPFEKMTACIDTLQEWGYHVQLGSTTHSISDNYFSATDEQRLMDLQSMLDDPNIKAILCARGGYGTSRLLDDLSFKAFKKEPKWIVGFSDITALHSHIYTNYNIASLHAQMAAAFNGGGASSPSVLSLKDALSGTATHYEIPPHELNRSGEGKGELVGGNLSLLCHLLCTDSDIKTKNRILFLEDIGEHLYHIDRMFLQLKRAGKLHKLAGLIIGGFTDMKDTERPFGKSVNEILLEHVSEFDYPVCFDFPVSHGKDNHALKVGVEHSFIVDSSGVQLKEL